MHYAEPFIFGFTIELVFSWNTETEAHTHKHAYIEGRMMFPQRPINSYVEQTQIPSRYQNPNKIHQQLREYGGTLERRSGIRPTFPLPAQQAVRCVWHGSAHGRPTHTLGHLYSTHVMAILILAGTMLILGM